MSDELHNLLKTVRGTATRKGINVPERTNAETLSALLGGPSDSLKSACEYLKGWISNNYDFERGREMLRHHIEHQRASLRLDRLANPDDEPSAMHRRAIAVQEYAFAEALKIAEGKR